MDQGTVPLIQPAAFPAAKVQNKFDFNPKLVKK